MPHGSSPHSGQISVVVQGPIAGKPGDPPEARLTLRCLRSVREHLPEAEIVLSTWKGSDVTGLPFDRLVESDDPGALRQDDGSVGEVILYNSDRQIVSTRAGLRAATRPYAMKLRSDMILTGTGFLGYFGRFPARAAEWRILRERVVAPTWYSRNPRRRLKYPFHPSDWFHFGLREDLLNLWDIPPVDPEVPRWFETRPRVDGDTETWLLYRYTVEQHNWLGFLRKHGPVRFEHKRDLANGAIALSERTIANNLVLVHPRDLNIEFVKYPVPVRDTTLYTHAEWQRLYREHCDPTFRPQGGDPWWERALVAGAGTFHTLHTARHSDAMNRVRRGWERRSPGSLRFAKRVFQAVFDSAFARLVYGRSKKRQP